MNDDLPKIIELTRRQVRHLLICQCLDPQSRNYGGFVTDNSGFADSRSGVFFLQTLFAAYLYPDFPEFCGKPELLERLRAGLSFMQRRQRRDGTVTMGAAGAGSGNEIGFTLLGVGETYRRVEAGRMPGRDEILATLGPYLERGAAAVRRLFPHTANHRWTACAAPLALVDRIFSDPANGAVIREYLGDGIDMDGDGLYYEERSPNYNMVADRGLLYLADYWGRLDFLDLIARNLRFSLAMRQPCGEAETLFSHRQDRGGAGQRWGDFLLFRRLSVEKQDGVFAQAADVLLAEEVADANPPVPLVPWRYFYDDSRLAAEAIPRQALPDRCDIRFREHPLWRHREGQVAWTVVADPGGHWWDATQSTWGGRPRSGSVLGYHAGGAIVDVVKICWGSGCGAFHPEAIEDLPDGGVRLAWRDTGWDHVAHYRPRDKWGPRRIICDQRGEMLIHPLAAGALRLDVTIDGWEELPVNVQFLLRENCRLQSSDGMTIPLVAGGTTFSAGGDFTLHGPDGCRLQFTGLPASEHHFRLGDGRSICGEAEHRCHRLIVGLFTPARLQATLTPDCRLSNDAADITGRATGIKS